MSFTIELSPELERQVRDAAGREGIDPNAYLSRVVARQLSAGSAAGLPQLEPIEAELLERISLGIAPVTWERYEQLLERRRAEALTEPEQKELIGISDQIESANARRMEHLVTLAQRRGVTLQQLMAQLGIVAGSHA